MLSSEHIDALISLGNTAVMLGFLGFIFWLIWRSDS